MLNASEKFWIQSKPVSSCRVLLPILIASGLNFNLNSPICLTHSLLSSQPLSFCGVLRICLNSAGFLVQQKPAIRLWMFSSCRIPLQHDACSRSAALLPRVAQSMSLPLLEWDCYRSYRRSALGPECRDSFWSLLKYPHNSISRAFCLQFYGCFLRQFTSF